MRVAGVAKASRNDTSDKATSPTKLTGGPKRTQNKPKMLQTKQATLPQDAAIDCGSNTMWGCRVAGGGTGGEISCCSSWKKLDLLSGSLHSSSQSSVTATPPPAPPSLSPSAAAAFVLSNAKDATLSLLLSLLTRRTTQIVVSNNMLLQQWTQRRTWGDILGQELLPCCCRFSVFCFLRKSLIDERLRRRVLLLLLPRHARLPHNEAQSKLKLKLHCLYLIPFAVGCPRDDAQCECATGALTHE